MRKKNQQNMRSSRSMQKKPFDPHSYADQYEMEEGLLDSLHTFDMDTVMKTKEHPGKAKKRLNRRPCHKCGSTSYTRLRYDNKALGFRRDSAIGCSKCVK